MAQSETNRAVVRFARESSWGEAVSSPTGTEARITSESLGGQKQTIVSNEVRSDRQRTAIIEVGQSADGDVNYELSWSDFESFFETALRGTIASTRVTNTSTVFAASTLSGANYSGFEAGQSVRIDGGHHDGAVAEVVSANASVMTITGTTLTASTVSANVNGRTLVNGTTKTSYFIEAGFDDIGAVKYFNGMRIANMSLSVQSQQIVTGVFSFQGKQAFASAVSTVTGSTVSAGTNLPMNAANDVAEIVENGAAIGIAVNSLSLSLNNNMRTRPQVGSKFTAEPGDGGLDVTGSLEAYFENVTLYKKMLDHTSSSIKLRFDDDAGNVIVVRLPSVKYAAGNPNVSGQDADVFLPLDFTAFRDATEGDTIRMDFLPV